LVAHDPSDIADLVEFCETGRIYAVERWIADGRPLQLAHEDTGWRRTPQTPLAAAIESNQYDLTRLLLCNGYDPELEPRTTLHNTQVETLKRLTRIAASMVIVAHRWW